MGRVKRIVEVSFWEDEKVLDYSPEDKYFMLYLMTNPKTTQLGIYHLPLKIAAFQLGYTLDSVSVLIDRFQTKYKNVIYNQETQEIAILNSLRYSIVKGGKPTSDLLTRELNNVRDIKLIEAVYGRTKRFWDISNRDYDQTVMELFESELKKRKEPKEKKKEKEKENDNDNEESYHESLHESYHESSMDNILDNFN